jgi:hypothetical protein
MQNHIADYDVDKLPKREVTKEGFRVAASRARWEQKSIDLFLLKGTPVRDFVKVAGELLRVTDW